MATLRRASIATLLGSTIALTAWVAGTINKTSMGEDFGAAGIAGDRAIRLYPSTRTEFIPDALHTDYIPRRPVLDDRLHGELGLWGGGQHPSHAPVARHLIAVRSTAANAFEAVVPSE